MNWLPSFYPCVEDAIDLIAKLEALMLNYGVHDDELETMTVTIQRLRQREIAIRNLLTMTYCGQPLIDLAVGEVEVLFSGWDCGDYDSHPKERFIAALKGVVGLCRELSDEPGRIRCSYIHEIYDEIVTVHSYCEFRHNHADDSDFVPLCRILFPDDLLEPSIYNPFQRLRQIESITGILADDHANPVPFCNAWDAYQALKHLAEREVSFAQWLRETTTLSFSQVSSDATDNSNRPPHESEGKSTLDDEWEPWSDWKDKLEIQAELSLGVWKTLKKKSSEPNTFFQVEDCPHNNRKGRLRRKQRPD